MNKQLSKQLDLREWAETDAQDLQLNMRKNFFTMQVTMPWN